MRHEVSSGSKVRGAGRGGETTDHVATGRRCLGAASGFDSPIAVGGRRQKATQLLIGYRGGCVHYQQVVQPA